MPVQGKRGFLSFSHVILELMCQLIVLIVHSLDIW